MQFYDICFLSLQYLHNSNCRITPITFAYPYVFLSSYVVVVELVEINFENNKRDSDRQSEIFYILRSRSLIIYLIGLMLITCACLLECALRLLRLPPARFPCSLPTQPTLQHRASQAFEPVTLFDQTPPEQKAAAEEAAHLPDQEGVVGLRVRFVVVGAPGELVPDTRIEARPRRKGS